MRLLLELQFVGTHFAGWQSQSQGERTVQDVLYFALQHLAQVQRPVAAGRTDSGVHALCMPVHVDVEQLKTPVDKLARAINAHLPYDVGVLSCKEVHGRFHARFNAVWRRYRYHLYLGQRQPLLQGRALHIPYTLNLAAMQEACALFVGTHNFSAFASQEDRQPVRRVDHCSLNIQGEHVYFEVQGESFLRHQVRAMVGTLLHIGRGRMGVSRLGELLQGAERHHAGMNVDACGLYFMGAGYDHLANILPSNTAP